MLSSIYLRLKVGKIFISYLTIGLSIHNFNHREKSTLTFVHCTMSKSTHSGYREQNITVKKTVELMWRHMHTIQLKQISYYKQNISD